jgi:hypothetical protein
MLPPCEPFTPQQLVLYLPALRLQRLASRPGLRSFRSIELPVPRSSPESREGNKPESSTPLWPKGTKHQLHGPVLRQRDRCIRTVTGLVERTRFMGEAPSTGSGSSHSTRCAAWPLTADRFLVAGARAMPRDMVSGLRPTSAPPLRGPPAPAARPWTIAKPRGQPWHQPPAPPPPQGHLSRPLKARPVAQPSQATPSGPTRPHGHPSGALTKPPAPPASTAAAPRSTSFASGGNRRRWSEKSGGGAGGAAPRQAAPTRVPLTTQAALTRTRP